MSSSSKLPLICTSNSSAHTGCFNFSKSNLTRGFFAMRLLFNLCQLDGGALYVMVTDNVVAKKRLCARVGLKLLRASLKSIWFCTLPFETCQVAVLDGLSGCGVLARVSSWLQANKKVSDLCRWSLLSHIYLLSLTSIGMRLVQP
ncbi:hypothetical protein DPMN_080263 [Dreissena polymorpha]|uniref:Uncharacterized protein n=1 Tax=Dreissena polymorpha TaxID=45954 RepID=A0A9D4BTP6_DREPO|nr:hypothetical protein DPMN_080263 [Dreissena polymorpha]